MRSVVRRRRLSSRRPQGGAYRRKSDRDQRQLGAAIPAERNSIRPDARIDIERTAGRFVKTVFIRPDAFWKNDRSDQRQSNLSAMRMAGENQIESAAKTIRHLRIMHQQNLARGLWRSESAHAAP